MKRGLGGIFLGDELSFKLYPCCKLTHTSIEATLALVDEHVIQPAEVKGVIVRVSPGAYQTVGAPFKIRGNPQVDAQFSIPYTVALALVKGKVGLDGFEEEVIGDPTILEMARKVRGVVDPQMRDHSENMVNLAAHVTISTSRGDFEKSLEICKGHPDRMVDAEAVYDKFRDCCRYHTMLNEEQIQNTIALLSNLEEIRDAEEIFKSLGFQARMISEAFALCV